MSRLKDLFNDDADMTAAGRRGLRRAATKIGASATTKYMRFGGTNVGPNQQTGPGSLRRQTGRLARSLIGARSAQPTPESIRSAPEGIFDLTPTSNGVKLTYGSEVPYAGVHEQGFSGTVQVSAHTRQQTHVFGRELDSPISVRVQSHTRRMDVPARPYLSPALEDTKDDIANIIASEVKVELFD